MTAKELDTMVRIIRKNNKIETRMDVLDLLYYLQKGIRAIGKKELAENLIELYTEIDSIDTPEIIKIGTFSKKNSEN